MSIRDSLEQRVFVWIERNAEVPRARRLLKWAIRGAMRASLAEQRALGSSRILAAMTAGVGRWGRFRAPRLRDLLGIDPESAADLGRIQDWEDALLDVDGTWVERGRAAAVKHEHACPFADLAARDTRFCTQLVHRLETETFRTIQPRYRLAVLDTLLSQGASHCVFRHEIAPPD